MFDSKSGEPKYFKIMQLVGGTGNPNSIDNNVVVSNNIHRALSLLNFPLRADALVVGVCLEGEIHGVINLKEWVAEAGSVLVSIPESVISSITVSDNCRGIIMAITADYLRSINIDLKSFIPYYLTARHLPCLELGMKEIRTIEMYSTLLIDALSDEQNSRREDVAHGLMQALMFKFCNYFESVSDSIDEPVITNGSENYFLRFMALLHDDFRQHRKVQHYADKLAVTPKYLSKIIAQVSGRSAAQWIDDYVVAEATMLLKFSDLTVQQIADKLNFASQSFFSKYIKQHTNLSPKNYRLQYGMKIESSELEQPNT